MLNQKQKPALLPIKQTMQKSWDVFQKCFKNLLIIQSVAQGIILIVPLIFAGIIVLWLSFSTPENDTSQKSPISIPSQYQSLLSPQAWTVQGAKTIKNEDQNSPDNKLDMLKSVFDTKNSPLLSLAIVTIVNLLISLTLTLFASSWTSAASIITLQEENKPAGLKQVFYSALRKTPAFALLSVIIWAIVSLGTLCFVVPGVVFALWFSLAGFVLIFEKKKLIESLKESKNLVQGYTWPIFLRILVFSLAALVVFLAGNFLPLVSLVVPIIISMFAFTYLYVIYRNLKEIKKTA